jgi:hypothetical protein
MTILCFCIREELEYVMKGLRTRVLRTKNEEEYVETSLGERVGGGEFL